MKEDKHKRESVFKLNGGMPPLGQVLPLAFQHIVAMIVGCVTPTVITVSAAGLSGKDEVTIVQAALVVSVLATLLQVLPVGFRRGNPQFGAGLLLTVEVGSAYVISMSTIVEGYGTATIFGAEIVGGIVAVLVGLSYNKTKSLFPPLIIGIATLCIGLSLYPIAIRYMAGGQGSESYGFWQNQLVAALILTAIVVCNNCSRGVIKLASTLTGIIVGYGVAPGFGMVDFSVVGRAGIPALPKIMHFRTEFEVSSCVAIGLLSAINPLQAMGDVTATTIGGMDGEAADKELRGGILEFGLSNVIRTLFGELSNVTFSRGAGIATITKMMDHWVVALAAIILGIVGVLPKFSVFLTNVPQCVLDKTIPIVFVVVVVTGIRMMFNTDPPIRSGLIVGIAVALGTGVTQASDALCDFPSWMTMVFAKTPVVIVTAVSILLNLLLPKDKEERQRRCVTEVQK